MRFILFFYVSLSVCTSVCICLAVCDQPKKKKSKSKEEKEGSRGVDKGTADSGTPLAPDLESVKPTKSSSKSSNKCEGGTIGGSSSGGGGSVAGSGSEKSSNGHDRRRDSKDMRDKEKDRDKDCRTVAAVASEARVASVQGRAMELESGIASQGGLAGPEGVKKKLRCVFFPPHFVLLLLYRL